MSVQTDVDSAVSTLKTAISAYTAAGGNASMLAQWLVSQIKQSDPAVARALDSTISRFVAEQPDRRSFAAIG